MCKHLCVLLHFPFFLSQNGPPDSLKSIDFTSPLATNRGECSLILNSDCTVLEGCQIDYNFPKYRNVASPFPCPQSLGHLLRKVPVTVKEGCERMSN